MRSPPSTCGQVPAISAFVSNSIDTTVLRSLLIISPNGPVSATTAAYSSVFLAIANRGSPLSRLWDLEINEKFNKRLGRGLSFLEEARKQLNVPSKPSVLMNAFRPSEVAETNVWKFRRVFLHSEPPFLEKRLHSLRPDLSKFMAEILRSSSLFHIIT
jgi:hypothetical protein